MNHDKVVTITIFFYDQLREIVEVENQEEIVCVVDNVSNSLKSQELYFPTVHIVKQSNKI